MVRCCLCFPACSGAWPSDLLQTRFRIASRLEARQNLQVQDPEDLAVGTVRAGFQGAPEEAEMAEAPFCEAPIHIQLWQQAVCALVSLSSL